MKELLSHVRHPVKQGVFHGSPLSTRKICPLGYYKIALFELAPHTDGQRRERKIKNESRMDKGILLKQNSRIRNPTHRETKHPIKIL